jgi:DNA-binding CsgD family transcriptional regulator
VRDRPLGRQKECDRLDEVIERVCRGRSSTLVLRGEAGIGKTVLLDHLARRAAEHGRVLRANGVGSEMELPFAGLHQLFLPILDAIPLLPAPQREAIEAAFGLRGGPGADRLMVALAGLNLLSEAAGPQRVFCVVDDAQWLDQPSLHSLLFIARRLLAEPIGLVLAAREDAGAFGGLPELEVGGLRDQDSLQLLERVVSGHLDPRVSRRILAETRGNPLAITQLPRGLTAAELAAGLGPSARLPLSGQIEQSFRRRYEKLPPTVRRLLLLAAAEPLGDPALLRRAAAERGLPELSVTAADTDGLMVIGLHVSFEHPLARSAVYEAAPGDERRAAHLAIARAVDADDDPDRRAWHRSLAADGPDEQIAAELEATAARARARGGLAASAAMLEHAALLSTKRADAVRRGLAAARAVYEAGEPDRALEVVAALEAAPLGPLERAQLNRLRGQIAVSLGRPHRAVGLLLYAAGTLRMLDPAASRETYLEALEATMNAGRFGPDGGLTAVAGDVVRLLPDPPAEPGLVDALLDSVLTWATEGLARALPAMRRALAGLSAPTTDPVAAARWAWLAYHLVIGTWDDEHWLSTTERYRSSVREAGALSLLPSALLGSASFALWTGEFAVADTLLADALGISMTVGLPPTALVVRAALTAWRGQRDETATIVERIVSHVSGGGDAPHPVDGPDEVHLRSVILANYCTAVLGNGTGDHAAAYAAARASAYEDQLGLPELVLPELVEAAVLVGDRAEAERALAHIVVRTTASGTAWALGVEAYCRALVADDDVAERFYRRAIKHFGACRIAPFRYRAHLVYGEWLRRERRRGEARDHLQTAYGALRAMGANGFAERARRELVAAGGTVARRGEETREALTPQELRIVELAAAEASDQEIAAQLFISPSTVGYHLGKAFRKLDVTSRRQLADVLRTLAVD